MLPILDRAPCEAVYFILYTLYFIQAMLPILDRAPCEAAPLAVAAMRALGVPRLAALCQGGGAVLQ